MVNLVFIYVKPNQKFAFCSKLTYHCSYIYRTILLSSKETIKGRGAQINPDNPYHTQHVADVHQEGIDEFEREKVRTTVIYDYPKKLINKVTSPDIGMAYSANPYQGCEHGCAYCYARNAHFYWGLSAGLDFETKLIVKPNAPSLLRNELAKKSWKPVPVVLSGNTDCYQPLEKKHRLTRQLLEVMLECLHPVSIITKNALILRDLDVLTELAKNNLVHVAISLTTLDEKLRSVMEPRTATGKQRLKVIDTLSNNNIPVTVMTAPIIPAINDFELPQLLKAASDAGALNAGYTMVRLNGALPIIFEDWIRRHFPERADKVLNKIKAVHGGKLNDAKFGRRMVGEGPIAEQVRQLFEISKKKYFSNKVKPVYNLNLFKRPNKHGQLSLL